MLCGSVDSAQPQHTATDDALPLLPALLIFASLIERSLLDVHADKPPDLNPYKPLHSLNP